MSILKFNCDAWKADILIQHIVESRKRCPVLAYSRD